MITKNAIVVVVSLGIAAMLAAGFVRILYSTPLNIVLSVTYGVILILSFFTSSQFLAISFDASGATTGALTVPFILAIALGVSSMKKDSKASEKDSFGLIAVTSTGAIIAVMVMSILSGTQVAAGGDSTAVAPVEGLFGPFLEKLPGTALEIFIALLPIAAIFIIFNAFSFRLARPRRRRIIIGLVYAFAGLTLFLTGVNTGFIDVGILVGQKTAETGNGALLVAVGFVLGFFTVLAEPAVHALTDQVESVTSGYVRRRTVQAALTIGIGLAVALSMLRILIPGLKLWHILLPGYAISLGLSYLVPKLFVGIAFDSGGVASGPMTTTFILVFAQGAAQAVEGADVLVDGFGIIALVALTPLVTLQILGLIYRLKSKKEGEKQSEPEV